MQLQPSLFLASALVLSAGCVIYSTDPNVHGTIERGTADLLFERASYDFNCPREQVHLTRLEGEAVGAEGCGNRGVYIRTVYGWALNSTTR